MDHSSLISAMDDCLLAILDNKPFPMNRLRSLPPWRAVLIAGIALRAEVISQKEYDELKNEAKEVGGNGRLKQLPPFWRS